MYSRNIKNSNFVYNQLLMGANQAGATVLNVAKHEFYPHGLTAAIILAESHITIHTYPETGNLYIDCFTCGKLHPKNILNKISKLLKAEVKSLKIIDRDK